MLAIESGESLQKPKNTVPASPFYLAVDRQLKSGYDTFEKAEKAALSIKRQNPRLLVSVYETSLRRHMAIEEPQSATTFKSERGMPAEGKAIARHAASTSRH